jgi:hypothetical protein
VLYQQLLGEDRGVTSSDVHVLLLAAKSELRDAEGQLTTVKNQFGACMAAFLLPEEAEALLGNHSTVCCFLVLRCALCAACSALRFVIFTVLHARRRAVLCAVCCRCCAL